jgi:NADPH-dependent curcumin reductase CurA
MAAWVANGQVKLHENDAQGLEQAPGAFIWMPGRA